MTGEIRHAVGRAEEDTSVVGIVITGAGRGFCAGADMEALKDISEGGGGSDEASDLDASPGDPEVVDYRGLHTYLMSVRKPVIAAINGPCAGMGLPLALACDMRFASDKAVFTTAFARRGLIAEWGLSWLLPLVVGPSHAFDLTLSGRRFDAAEAADLGVVNRVFAHDELMLETRAYIEDVAQNCSPTSLKIMKRQIYEDLTLSLPEAEEKAIRLMNESLKRKDFKEGVASFLEKRPPKFRPGLVARAPRLPAPLPRRRARTRGRAPAVRPGKTLMTAARGTAMRSPRKPKRSAPIRSATITTAGWSPMLWLWIRGVMTKPSAVWTTAYQPITQSTWASGPNLRECEDHARDEGEGAPDVGNDREGPGDESHGHREVDPDDGEAHRVEPAQHDGDQHLAAQEARHEPVGEARFLVDVDAVSRRNAVPDALDDVVELRQGVERENGDHEEADQDPGCTREVGERSLENSGEGLEGQRDLAAAHALERFGERGRYGDAEALFDPRYERLGERLEVGRERRRQGGDLLDEARDHEEEQRAEADPKHREQAQDRGAAAHSRGLEAIDQRVEEVGEDEGDGERRQRRTQDPDQHQKHDRDEDAGDRPAEGRGR